MVIKTDSGTKIQDYKYDSFIVEFFLQNNAPLVGVCIFNTIFLNFLLENINLKIFKICNFK